MNGRANSTTANLTWEQTREIYVRRLLAGETLERLARELSCDPEALARDLQQAEVRLEAELGGGPQQLRVQHTVRLEEIFLRALSGYDRSCEDEVTHKRTAQGVQAGDATDDARAHGTIELPKLRLETVTRRKGGNARFLWEARSALSDIRRMWTLKPAPKKKADELAAAAREALKSASDEELATLSAAESVLKRLAGRTTDEATEPEAEFDDNMVRPTLEHLDRDPAVD